MTEFTALLQAIDRGEPQAASQLLPLVYDELRKLAAHKLSHETPGQTLDATALVHEAYLRLVGGERSGSPPAEWDGRGHFFAAAAEAMRRILVERARRKGRLKRGGDRARQDLTVAEPAVPALSDDILALDEALTKLAATDPKAAELVQLRYFTGLPLPEVARILGVAPRTADRLWSYARAWLHEEIHGE